MDMFTDDLFEKLDPAYQRALDDGLPNLGPFAPLDSSFEAAARELRTPYPESYGPAGPSQPRQAHSSGETYRSQLSDCTALCNDYPYISNHGMSSQAKMHLAGQNRSLERGIRGPSRPSKPGRSMDMFTDDLFEKLDPAYQRALDDGLPNLGPFAPLDSSFEAAARELRTPYPESYGPAGPSQPRQAHSSGETYRSQLSDCTALCNDYPYISNHGMSSQAKMHLAGQNRSLERGIRGPSRPSKPGRSMDMFTDDLFEKLDPAYQRALDDGLPNLGPFALLDSSFEAAARELRTPYPESYGPAGPSQPRQAHSSGETYRSQLSDCTALCNDYPYISNHGMSSQAKMHLAGRLREPEDRLSAVESLRKDLHNLHVSPFNSYAADAADPADPEEDRDDDHSAADPNDPESADEEPEVKRRVKGKGSSTFSYSATPFY
ncbi:uncharacterized protein LOC122260142 [Penaeus japonicus]|uniref:uncharacterized protein LOC122260142 n=1 Tax=Penaeus japonicus TaxID=27405 RepID=UPI001C7144B5|nr:uncharacterized protein LOC122260142 [Penaeus japonicus]